MLNAFKTKKYEYISKVNIHGKIAYFHPFFFKDYMLLRYYLHIHKQCGKSGRKA